MATPCVSCSIGLATRECYVCLFVRSPSSAQKRFRWLLMSHSRAIGRETRRRAQQLPASMAEPRRSARVNAPGQSTDTPERRKPPRRRVPTPPQSTSRQAKRTTRVRPLAPSLVAEILVSPDLLPHMLEHLSMRQLHRVSAVCRAFRAAVPTALLLRRALNPKPTRGAHVYPNPKPA